YVAFSDANNSFRINVYRFNPDLIASMTVSDTSITDLGLVAVGKSSSLTYTIQNDGCTDLIVSNLGTNEAAFTVSPSNTTVPALGSTQFTVTFTPQVGGSQSATISLVSNDSGSPTEFVVTGEGLLAKITASATQTCTGDQVTLTASTGDSYLWSTGETTQSITKSPTITTTYSVTVTVGTVSSGVSERIVANPLPAVSITGSTEVCAGQMTQLTALGTGSFGWSNGATSTTVIAAAGEYSVTITGANGCVASSVSFTVTENTLIPEVSLTLNTTQADEDSGTSFIFTFTRTGDSCAVSGDLTVNFSLSGTATFNDDFFYVSGANSLSSSGGTVTILEGETSVQLILQVQSDAVEESDETIVVTIENP
ncbi:MAG: choice-of-anchor D domain-containing protein, partial [Bacteroidota bacterium]